MQISQEKLPRDLGMSEKEAIAILESPGDHDLLGFVDSEGQRTYLNCLTERSEVQVSTKAAESCRMPFASSPRDVTGYQVFVSDKSDSTGVFIASTDRAKVKELHAVAVAVAKEDGTQAAINIVQDKAEELGIETIWVP